MKKPYKKPEEKPIDSLDDFAKLEKIEEKESIDKLTA